MDQLDLNLSKLRIALVERQRAKAHDMAPGAPQAYDVGADDKLMSFETSTKQLATPSIRLEPARSWFQRLFGI